MKKRKLAQTDFSQQTFPSKMSVFGEGLHSYSVNVDMSTDYLKSFPGGPMLATHQQSSVRLGDRSFDGTGVRALHSQRRVPDMGPDAELELRRVIDNFVAIYEQLDRCEGAHVKPNYSYTELAYLAMLRAPNFCLPITEIYRYIQSRFLFFKHSTRKHWKNAVRHSLAKTMCFSKIPRGKGPCGTENLSRSQYLWCIIPTSITSFARGDYRPGVDKESGTNTLRWGFYRVNAGNFWDQVGDYITVRMDRFKASLQDPNTASHIFENQICVLQPQDGQPNNNPTRLPLNSIVHQDNDLMKMRRPSSVGGQNVKHKASHTFSTSPPATLTPTYHPPVQETDVKFPGDPFLRQISPTTVRDPWLSRTVRSPNTSLGSVDSAHLTPPRFNSYDGRDSGNETCESSPEVNYFKFYPSCQQQNQLEVRTLSPTQPQTSPFQCRSSCDDFFGQIELSPFSEAELSQLCPSLNDSFENPRLSAGLNSCRETNTTGNSCKFYSPMTSPSALFQQPMAGFSPGDAGFESSSFDFSRNCSSPLYNLQIESEISFSAITGWNV